MKTIILTLLAVAGMGFATPSAEAHDRRDHGRRGYSHSHRDHHRHYGHRPRVIYRSYPRYYYSGYGQRYYYTDPYYRPYRYYRPAGATFILRF